MSCYLLSLDCAVTIVNRTYSRAQELATLFAHTGGVCALEMESLAGRRFDLIINTTSSGISGDVPAVPASLINTHVYCYDMFYQKGCTPFYTGADHGATMCADGLEYAGGAGRPCRSALAWGSARDYAVIQALHKELNT